MDISDTSAVIEALNNAAGGSPETWRIETFTMHRESKTYGGQDVTIKIQDRGPDISPRYFVSATADTGQAVYGNSGDELDLVIDTAHWYQLDQ